MPLERNDIESALKEKGFEMSTKKGRDHRYYHFWYKGKRTPIFTKISTGTRYRTIADGGVGGVNKMARSLKLSQQQFKELVRCPFKEKHYIAHLLDKKHMPQ